MKKLLIVLMALAFVAGFYATVNALITSSAHDFTSKSWISGDNKMCKACHTPHDATEATSGPLWDHEITAVTNYGVYTSPTGTLDATVGQPGGVSKLCLSCHDGTVALDSFGGASGGTYIGTGELLGTDLSDDHPISFTYNAALASADGELVTPTGGTVGSNNLPLYGGSNDQMECSSCHDAHNTPGIAKLLLMANPSSELCLNCHSK